MPRWIDPTGAAELLGRARSVHVTGAPGAGKSTVAAHLAARLGVVPTDLDEIARAPGTAGERFGARPVAPPLDRAAAVAALLGKEVRVTEGIYCGWTDALLLTADVVVWLDLPVRTVAVRNLRRTLRPPHEATRRGAASALLRATWSYPRGRAASDEELRRDDRANSRRTLALRLALRDGPVVRCTSSRQVDRLHHLPGRS